MKKKVISVLAILGFSGILFAACGEPAPVFQNPNEGGGYGESCLRSQDCQNPLICVDQKCQNPGSACIPSDELCDGKDNDCDDLIDEDLGLNTICQAGFGICQTSGHVECGTNGETVCITGTFIEPQPETCNGLDDDCNGVVDDQTIELGQQCWDETQPTLFAGWGKLTGCENGVRICTPTLTATEEKCQLQNQVLKDDDLDGKIDEGCPCLNGVMYDCYKYPPETLGVGACISGDQIQCSQSNVWTGGECGFGLFNSILTKENTAQKCFDGKDNDCDGKTDLEDYECWQFQP